MTTFIWDMDGTLIDSYDVFMAALAETFETYGLDFEPVSTRKFILTHSVNDFLMKQASAFEELKKSFTGNTTKKNNEIKLMAGAREVLDWAAQQGIRNFLITHKGENAFKLLEDLKVSAYFTEVITSQSGFARKPDPESAIYLIKKYQLDKTSTYYLGDRQLDIDFALNAGIQSINFLPAEGSQQIQSLADVRQIFSSL
ncbi:MAG: HAD-IA family hydrolase [Streptococcaceae bacterium]|jgi:HAD superfamily hydrolase (TIGR01549 family)|nr:HAD-IA family hydrolase [Streptococcaceae bacterium]